MRFACDGSRVLTTGRGDGVVLQWTVVEDEVSPLCAKSEEDLAANSKDLELIADSKSGALWDRSAAAERCGTYDESAVFAMEERGLDEDYAPLRAWQRCIVAPSRALEEDLSAPSDRLELEWVHGVRCEDCRAHVRYCVGSREILFPAATLVVVMDAAGKTQRFFKQHCAAVLAVATHPTRSLVATGDVCKRPAVHVWDYASEARGGGANGLESLVALRGYHHRAVLMLAFSPREDAKFLVSIGADDAHTATVFDWAKRAVACAVATRRERPLTLIFNRLASGFGGGLGFATAGDGFLTFWTCKGRDAAAQQARVVLPSKNTGTGSKNTAMNTNSQFAKKKVVSKPSTPTYLCLAWQGSQLLAGCLDGSLLRLSGRALDKQVQAHFTGVNCVWSNNEGVATGGRDGLIKLWSTALSLRLQIDLGALSANAASVRSVQWDDEQALVLCCTLGAEIWEFDANDGTCSNADGQAALTAHFAGEVWARDVQRRAAIRNIPVGV